MDHALTLGELRRAATWFVLSKMSSGTSLPASAARETLFPGIIGYDQTVVPALVNAILSRHDIILLGLRGQAKTRIVRQLHTLLDEYVPVVKGSEVNDNPFAPVSKFAVDLVQEMGDRTPIEWLHRSRRYGEKLATPDVTIADLIGDIDPIKAAAQRLHYAHEGAIHFGIIPRTNRGIFAINELPISSPAFRSGFSISLKRKTSRSAASTYASRWTSCLCLPPTLKITPTGEHHHAAQGPHRLADPDALPAFA